MHVAEPQAQYIAIAINRTLVLYQRRAHCEYTSTDAQISTSNPSCNFSVLCLLLISSKALHLRCLIRICVLCRTYDVQDTSGLFLHAHAYMLKWEWL